MQELLNQSRKQLQQSEDRCLELQEENASLQTKLENSLKKPAATKLTQKSAAYKDLQLKFDRVTTQLELRSTELTKWVKKYGSEKTAFEAEIDRINKENNKLRLEVDTLQIQNMNNTRMFGVQAPRLNKLENDNKKLQDENFELREEKMLLEVQLRSLMDVPRRNVSSPPNPKKSVRETLKPSTISEKGFYGSPYGAYDSDVDHIQPVFKKSPNKKQKLVVSDSEDDLDLSL